MTIKDFLEVFEYTDFEIFDISGEEGVCTGFEYFTIFIQDGRKRLSFKLQELKDNDNYMNREIIRIERIRTTGFIIGASKERISTFSSSSFDTAVKCVKSNLPRSAST